MAALAASGGAPPTDGDNADAEFQTADSLKDAGNELFKTGRFLGAVDLYTRALALGPSTPALFCNRAAAHLKLENYGTALADAESALELDKTFQKAYYRRACVNMALQRLGLAARDFKALLKANPASKDVAAQLAECERQRKAKVAEAFSRAGGGEGGEEDEAGGSGGGHSHDAGRLHCRVVPLRRVAAAAQDGLLVHGPRVAVGRARRLEHERVGRQEGGRQASGPKGAPGGGGRVVGDVGIANGHFQEASGIVQVAGAREGVAGAAHVGVCA